MKALLYDENGDCQVILSGDKESINRTAANYSDLKLVFTQENYRLPSEVPKLED